MIKNSLSDKYLTKDKYLTVDISPGIKFSDDVIIYNTGSSWKVVPLVIMMECIILYDVFESSTERYDITLFVSPYSIFAAAYRGTIVVSKISKDGNFVLKNKNEKKHQNKFIPESHHYIDDPLHKIFRYEARIMKMRNVIDIYNDPKFIKVNYAIDTLTSKVYLNDEKMIDIKKTLNTIFEYHPKTIVYVIQYISKKTQIYKHAIIVGITANKNNPSGSDFISENFSNYLKFFSQKIIDRNAFQFPMFYYVAKQKYPDAKVVKIK